MFVNINKFASPWSGEGTWCKPELRGIFCQNAPLSKNSPPDYFGNSPLKGLNNASGGQGLWVSPAGSVGASAFGRGLHRRGRLPAGDPHPLDPASLLKKAWRKLYAMLYQTSVLCIFTFLLIYSFRKSFLVTFFLKKFLRFMVYHSIKENIPMFYLV